MALGLAVAAAAQVKSNCRLVGRNRQAEDEPGPLGHRTKPECEHRPTGWISVSVNNVSFKTSRVLI